jgi:hypothetical protein
MRFLSAGLSALLVSAGGWAEASESGFSRTERMAFGECVLLMKEVSDELGVMPTSILQTKDVRIIRIEAADGVVILTCSRPDGTLVLVKRPRP